MADDKKENKPQGSAEPSMTFSLFVTWILPTLLFALISRYAVDTDPGTIHVPPRPKPLKPSFAEESPERAPSQVPTNYQEILDTIRRRRRIIPNVSSSPSTPSPPPKASAHSSSRGPSSDPTRTKLLQNMERLKEAHRNAPDDVFAAIAYADALRLYELQYHEGGRFEAQAIAMFEKVVELSEGHRQALLDAGQSTTANNGGVESVHDEITLDYLAKSADGLLCSVLCNQGRVYYLANMFEKSVDSYNRCLAIADDYLDARNARGSSLIILGRYAEAARDFMDVIKTDYRRIFHDAFTGLSRVLAAQEDAIEEGWDGMVAVLEQAIPQLEQNLKTYPQGQATIAGALNRYHHALFTYHDAKTKDSAEAWRHLTAAFQHKMSLLPPWHAGFEKQKVQQTMQIFRAGFWPENTGSQTLAPIFIIGFVRSGSTLLERVLDAHPMIVGTGENSVFNGRLDEMRNKIVEVTATGQNHLLGSVTEELAESVVDEMKRRWRHVEANTHNKSVEDIKDEPERLVDKMLTNYYNVGFIHMLYPRALILHVAREPMDTIFSAYKHEFPPGTLDYTSEFGPLAELYHGYRDLIEHWDRVLPGRVTHVRYEDLVHDMPGMAKAIIAATGLPWDEGVLEFHKKKHAVNTLSTTQVRKGVYKDSLKAWMRYEKELQPLVDLIGERTKYDLKTTLKGYQPPAPVERDES